MLAIPQPRTAIHRLNPARRLLVLIAALGGARRHKPRFLARYVAWTPHLTEKFQKILRKSHEPLKVSLERPIMFV